MVQCRFRLDAVRNVVRWALIQIFLFFFTQTIKTAVFYSSSLFVKFLVLCVFFRPLFAAIDCGETCHQQRQQWNSTIYFCRVTKLFSVWETTTGKGLENGQSWKVSYYYSESSWHLFMCRVKKKVNLSSTVITVTQKEKYKNRHDDDVGLFFSSWIIHQSCQFPFKRIIDASTTFPIYKITHCEHEEFQELVSNVVYIKEEKCDIIW